MELLTKYERVSSPLWLLVTSFVNEKKWLKILWSALSKRVTEQEQLHQSSTTTTIKIYSLSTDNVFPFVQSTVKARDLESLVFLRCHCLFWTTAFTTGTSYTSLVGLILSSFSRLRTGSMPFSKSLHWCFQSMSGDLLYALESASVPLSLPPLYCTWFCYWLVLLISKLPNNHDSVTVGT